MIIEEATEHDVQVALAEDLMEKEDYGGAAVEAQKVLGELEPSLPTIAQAALVKGRALTNKASTLIQQSGEVDYDEFNKAWQAYELSQRLNPECDQTKREKSTLSQWLRKFPPRDPPPEVAFCNFDVLIVGAGAAGIGVACMLTDTFGIDKSRVVLVERGAEVGESFRQWPAETRFISPSFNQQGWTNSFDLNSVARGTSPAYSLHSEHPNGVEYANYLTALTKKQKLNVRTRTEVVTIRPKGTERVPLFEVDVRNVTKEDGSDDEMIVEETLTARYVVWAAGEFQYPKGKPNSRPTDEKSQDIKEEEEKKEGGDKTEDRKFETDDDSSTFAGAELCLHNSQVRSYAKLPGDNFLIIGGYESGIDAAFNLAKAGKKCKVLASSPCWEVKTVDPSSELAPYTAARLREVTTDSFSGWRPTLLAPFRVVGVERNPDGFTVTAVRQEEEKSKDEEQATLRQSVNTEADGNVGNTLVLNTPQAPLLCTGFQGSVAAAAGYLFEFAPDANKDNCEKHKNDEQCEKHDHKHKPKCIAGAPLLSEHDESTKIPGVFLVGPTVSHGSLSFCFVYKFRQRFAIVASKICEGLRIDTRAAVEECRKANMYLDEFSCCTGDTCGDVC